MGHLKNKEEKDMAVGRSVWEVVKGIFIAEHIEDKDTAVIQGIRRCVKKHRTNRDLYKK